MSEKVTLIMGGHDRPSEAVGQGISFPERAFASLRMAASYGLQLKG